MPKISIIVPVYNVEKYLKRCLDSISTQTFTDWECILVDDGSVDKSGKICDEYVEKDNRFIVIHQKNAGVSVARNTGLENATGEWIGFVDSDDFISPNMYKILFDNAINNNCMISICGYDYLFEKKIVKISNKKICKKINQKQAIKSLKRYHWIEAGPCNKLFHRDVIKTKFDISLSFGEDTIFLIESILNTNSIYIDSTSLYTYFQRSGSLSHSYTENIKSYVDRNLKLLKNKSFFLTIYYYVTRCYVDFIYSVNNKQKMSTSTKLVILLLFTQFFSNKTKIAISIYKFFPNVYLKIKNRVE